MTNYGSSVSRWKTIVFFYLKLGIDRDVAHGTFIWPWLKKNASIYNLAFFCFYITLYVHVANDGIIFTITSFTQRISMYLTTNDKSPASPIFFFVFYPRSFSFSYLFFFMIFHPAWLISSISLTFLKSSSFFLP